MKHFIFSWTELVPVKYIPWRFLVYFQYFNYCIGNLWFVLLSVLHTNHIYIILSDQLRNNKFLCATCLGHDLPWGFTRLGVIYMYTYGSHFITVKGACSQHGDGLLREVNHKVTETCRISLILDGGKRGRLLPLDICAPWISCATPPPPPGKS